MRHQAQLGPLRPPGFNKSPRFGIIVVKTDIVILWTKGEINTVIAGGGGWVGTVEYCMAAASSGSVDNQASAAKAKVFFEQWEEDKGSILGRG